MTIKEEFEKEFKPTIRDEVLRGAVWMAEKLAVKAYNPKKPFEYMDYISSDEIRQLAKELS